MKFIQLASRYLAQAEQLANLAKQAPPGSLVRRRQEVMATRALRKAIEYEQKAIERMGTQDVQEDDGSFS